EHILGRAVSPGSFHMMGQDLFLGREFLPEEGRPGKDHVVILAHRLWEHLGADQGIVGKQLRMSGESYTVVGVAAAAQADRLESQFTIPLSFKPDQINHEFRWLLVLGRLKNGVSLAQAQADMELVTKRIAQEHPRSNKGWSASVEPLHLDFFSQEDRRVLWL